MLSQRIEQLDSRMSRIENVLGEEVVRSLEDVGGVGGNLAKQLENLVARMTLMEGNVSMLTAGRNKVSCQVFFLTSTCTFQSIASIPLFLIILLSLPWLNCSYRISQLCK